MRLRSCIVLLSVLLSPAASQAQETVSAPTPGASEAASIDVQKQKPYLVPSANMLMRCKVQAFLNCMKWTEPECVSVIERATVDGNAEVEAKAASKPESETSGDFFKGYAIGVVIGKIQAASQGRLLGCLSAGKT